MNTKRFISFKDGEARFGLDRSATWLIDLEKKRQGLRTNPALSIFDTEFGVNWVDLNYDEKEGNKFICDDDDGYLWLVPTNLVDDGESITTQEQLIDDEFVEVCINIEDLTFYEKGNGCFAPIK